MNVERELRKAGVKPVKGQNFLNSENVIEALVESGEVDGETVLEVGAGTGAITEEIAGRAEEVIALETDTVLCGMLEDRFPGEDVKVVNGNFLEYEIPGNVSRCVSNLPFQISSDAIQKLGEEQLQSSLILQEELADKIVSEPGSGSYGFYSIRTQYFFVPVKLRTVSRSNFYPEPEVDAAIVKLYPNRERWGVENEEEFFRVGKALFNNKRKKVRNAFVDARHLLGIEKDEAKDLRDQLPHSEERVVNLGVREISEIAGFLG